MIPLVKTRIVKIGNSHGVRIPKWLLEQVGLTGEVEIEAQTGQLIIRLAHSIRQGWDEQFEAMAREGDDQLLDGETLPVTSWETEEWEW